MLASHVEDASMKRKREEREREDNEENALRPKPLGALPREVRDVLITKYTELQTVFYRSSPPPEYQAQFTAKLVNEVRQAVEVCPDIVQVQDQSHLSLLLLLCRLPGNDILSPHQAMYTEAIKLAIEFNPFALCWSWSYTPDRGTHGRDFDEDEDNDSTVWPFEFIAFSPHHCRLLPWIVEHYGYVLCSGFLDNDPLMFDLVMSYAGGMCGAVPVRLFFGAYPKGLKQMSKRKSDRAVEGSSARYDPLNPRFEDAGQRYPLHYAMRQAEPDQEDYDLFEWMIQQNPEALKHQDPFGRTILHQIFMDPAIYPIYAQVVIDAYPDIIFVKDRKGKYAAHYLSSRSVRGNGHSWIDDIILVFLIRRMISKNLIDDELRADPFVAGIEKVLEKEHQLSMNSVQIRLVEMMVDKAIAVKSGDASVLSEVKEVYGDWSRKHLSAIKDAIAQSTNEDIPRIRSETRGVQNQQEDDLSDDNNEEEGGSSSDEEDDEEDEGSFSDEGDY